MDVVPGWIYFEIFSGGIQWFMMEGRDFVSIINFKSGNEIRNLVSFNGQSIVFRLLTKEV